MHAKYYIIRPGPVTTLPSGGLLQGPGRLVPLVPVDQLPDWLEIVGIPRQLRPEDAVKMVAIGGATDGYEDEIYRVRLVDPRAGGQDVEPDKEPDKGPREAIKGEVNIEAGENSRQSTRISADKSIDKVGEAAGSTPYTAVAASRPAVKVEEEEKVDLKTKEINASDTSATVTARDPHPDDHDGPTDYELLCKVIDRLNATPMSHLLTDGVEGLPVTDPGVSNGKPKHYNEDLIQLEVPDFEVFVKGRPPRTPKLDKAAKANKTETDATAHIPVDKTPKGTEVVGCWRFVSETKGEDIPDSEGGPGRRSSDTWTRAGGSFSQTPQQRSAWPLRKKAATSVRPCKFWCHFGRCAYNNGCRFAHVMPLTPEGLRSVNLDRLPQWWQDKSAGKKNGHKPDKGKSPMPRSPVSKTPGNTTQSGRHVAGDRGSPDSENSDGRANPATHPSTATVPPTCTPAQKRPLRGKVKRSPTSSTEAAKGSASSSNSNCSDKAAKESAAKLGAPGPSKAPDHTRQTFREVTDLVDLTDM